MRSIRERILKVQNTQTPRPGRVSCSEVDPGEDTESVIRFTVGGNHQGCSEVDPGEDTESYETDFTGDAHGQLQ